MKLDASDKEALYTTRPAFCRAQVLKARGPQALSPDVQSRFSAQSLTEIRNSLRTFDEMQARAKESFVFRPLSLISRLFSDTRDPVFWDQALWEAVDTPNEETVRSLTGMIEVAPAHENRISVLLAVAHSAHANQRRAAEFFESVSEDGTDPEIAEWATLFLREMLTIARDDFSYLNVAISSRDYNYDPSRRFDVVLPLMFAGTAFTSVGGVVKKTVISPLWFYRIFGRATALVRLETIETDLIIEKRLEGINPDGSPHFEVFPFAGDTQTIAPNIRSHNYWADLRRPFYSSGRTGIVGEGEHVVKGVRMTFERVGETQSPDRYRVAGGNLVESTRGIFFGHGHVDVGLLLKNRFDLKPGNFQLSPTDNPITGEPANTEFFGTFYGKVSDWDGDRRIDFNTLPVHSTVDGRVDYLGDGSGAPTSLRPEDWSHDSVY